MLIPALLLCSCGEGKGTRRKPGETVVFGSYPQTAASHGGIMGRIAGLRSYESSPIEWNVLALKGEQALLISRYMPDSKPYNETYAYFTSEKDRVAGGTEYASAHGPAKATQQVIDEYQAYDEFPLTEGACDRWLRSPGETADCAAMIGFEGTVSRYGTPVNDGWIGYGHACG